MGADQPLRCLERTLQEGDDNLEFLLQTAPEFDFLRTDPRFLDLVRRVGFKQYERQSWQMDRLKPSYRDASRPPDPQKRRAR